LPVRRRAALAAVLAALLVGLPAFGSTAFAASSAATTAPAPADAVSTAPKVVIVVGAVETVTSSFRTDADSLYAEAIKYTPNVVKVYSPNATWAAVSAAAQGASIFIYLGHGYGFPSPYKPVLTPSVHDGMGLNQVANNGDADKQYYGESVVASGIKLAKNAFVILDHACYSAGSSESGMAEPTIPVAKERVDNFASGFLRAGARAVMADAADGNVIAMIRSIFTTHQTIGNAWDTQYFAHHHDIVWQPLRNPAYTADMDPDTPTTGFHRSLVGDFDLTTDEIVAGASAPRTDSVPPTLQAPGAATVGSTALPLATDASLATPLGSWLAPGTNVRVTTLQTSPAAAQVQTFNGATTGWVAPDGLVPRDSASPLLWSLDGPLTITPNFDGDHDSLNLVGRFSESVSWKATITDGGGATLRTVTGSGELAAISWTPWSGTTPVAAGDYGLAIHATDAWGNPALDTTAVIHVQTPAIPPTGVLSFVPTASITTSSTVSYNLTFASPVAGLSASDFTITGSAAGCLLGTPTGSGATYVVTVTGCGTGTVGIQLEPGTVSAGTTTGPAGLIAAPSAIVDLTAPTVTSPTVAYRAGIVISGSTLPAAVSWTGADSGSGVKSYDVARSTDGGSFLVVATGLASPTWVTTMASGHHYRFEVRAHDKAGHTGTWLAGPTLYPNLIQQTGVGVALTGAWTATTSTSDSGGSAIRSGAAGASTTYTFSGRAVALVVDTCSTCGQVQVFIDGVYKTTLDTYAATGAYRFVLYSIRYGTLASHSVKLVVVGTAGRPNVYVDAFEVIS